MKTAYILVLPASLPVPVFEGFENYSTLDNIEQWEVVNSGGNNKWELTNTVGLASSNSARLMNSNQPIGTIDELVSAPVDLSGINGSMTLSFRYAYKRKSSQDDDFLRVYVTSDCGDNWAVRKTLHGGQITTATQASAYVPAADNEWTTVHMTNITNTYWSENFRYKFQFEAGGGNNIYLDNINIYAGAPSDNLIVGISENEGVDGLAVYPNPADEELNVRFAVNNAQTTMVHVQDLSGKILQTYAIQANVGSNLMMINTQELASGMYFLSIESGGFQQTVQFTVK
ncbi:MAG: hypothetical protein A3D92_02780 [Bacteroidetes bacterium RIFCSPHIGHO2_02_FULL_44_7]|nr:MAG: hypothetical protein A3D92_02780 [Bacteroidetes bacterium RIFCSPHIGHO2_02_FULL_44_7]